MNKYNAKINKTYSVVLTSIFCFASAAIFSETELSIDRLAEAGANEKESFFSKGWHVMVSGHDKQSVLKLLDEKTGLEGMVAVAWSVDSKSLATAGDSLKVNVWDSKSLSKKLELEQPSRGGGVNNVAYSSDGRYLAFGLRAVDIWNLASGNLHVRLSSPPPPQVVAIEAMAFSPDGKKLVVAYHGDRWRMSAFNVESGELLWRYEPQPVLGKLVRPISHAPILFSADGAMVIVGTGERGGADVNLKRLSRILFLNASSGELIRSIDDVHTDYPSALAISPDGQLIASGTTTGSSEVETNLTTNQVITTVVTDPVRIWSFISGKLVKELPISGTIRALVFSPSGRFLIGAKSELESRMTLVVWSVDTGAIVQTIKHNSLPMGLAVSPDGKKIAAASGDALSIYEFGNR